MLPLALLRIRVKPRNREGVSQFPTGSQVLPENLFQCGLLSPWALAPVRSQLQHGLPTGSQPPSGIHLLQHGVPSTGCKWMSAPSWTSMDCSVTACLTTVFITGCRGKIYDLVPGAPPPTPASLTLVSAGLFLSHIFTLLSQLLHSIFMLS